MSADLERTGQGLRDARLVPFSQQLGTFAPITRATGWDKVVFGFMTAAVERSDVIHFFGRRSAINAWSRGKNSRIDGGRHGTSDLRSDASGPASVILRSASFRSVELPVVLAFLLSIGRILATTLARLVVQAVVVILALGHGSIDPSPVFSFELGVFSSFALIVGTAAFASGLFAVTGSFVWTKVVHRFGLPASGAPLFRHPSDTSEWRWYNDGLQRA